MGGIFLRLMISVVVLNYNGAALLPRCLESLLAQDAEPLEILVVDNQSSDNSAEVVADYAQVRWLARGVNDGIGPGYNAGIAAASGEQVFCVNNDMWFDASCVRLLSERMGPDVFSVDPTQLTYEGERVIHGAQQMYRDWRGWSRDLPLIRFDNLQVTDQPMEVVFACAGAFLVDKQKWQSLGGLDETFFMNYEDCDICWRAWMRGWRTLYEPGARVYHKVGGSADAQINQRSGASAPARPVRNDQRQRYSMEHNRQRWIWKCMPLRTILLLGLLQSLRLLAGLFTLHWYSCASILRANLRCLLALPTIWTERRALRGAAVHSSRELLRRFVEP